MYKTLEKRSYISFKKSLSETNLHMISIGWPIHGAYLMEN